MFDVYKSPVGNILIESDNLAVTKIRFVDNTFYYKIEETLLSRMAKTQLSQYFDGRLHKFNLPLRPTGTPFQKMVWNELMKIPFGETKSCSDIVAESGGKLTVTTIGMANSQNPIEIIIPCHRVTEGDGNINAFSEKALRKDFLLKHEKSFAERF